MFALAEISARVPTAITVTLTESNRGVFHFVHFVTLAAAPREREESREGYNSAPGSTGFEGDNRKLRGKCAAILLSKKLGGGLRACHRPAWSKRIRILHSFGAAGVDCCAQPRRPG